MPSETDIVAEARELANREPYRLTESDRRILRSLADEVAALRATIIRITQDRDEDD